VTTPGIHHNHPGPYKLCRHPDCLTHRARYLKRWQYERAQGKKRLTDAAPARRHIDTLLGAGWSLRAIAGASSTSPTTIHKIKAGQPTVRHSIAAAILAVTPDQVPTKASNQTTEPFVPRIGTTRRIQALLYMGWTHAEITRRAGVATKLLLNQQGRWVTRSSHDKVAAVYDQIAMTAGPSNLTRGWARSLGYIGPLAWDDIDLDPAPHDIPHDYQEESSYAASVRERLQRKSTDLDTVAIERRIGGDQQTPLTKAERRELVARCHAAGMNDILIADRTGLSSATVSDDRKVLGLPAVTHTDEVA
jgi:hypothetical protein